MSSKHCFTGKEVKVTLLEVRKNIIQLLMFTVPQCEQKIVTKIIALAIFDELVISTVVWGKLGIVNLNQLLECINFVNIVPIQILPFCGAT